MTANLQSPIFNDETAAREALEAVRWPNGPVCPHCGNADPDTMPLVEGTKRSHRPGLRYCNACRGQFTVTVGTVFERSKIPLSKWWLAMHLMGSSKKGISAHQLWRMLGFGSYRTAWFMAHRIREAMKAVDPSPLGGSGKVVEADETYHARSALKMLRDFLTLADYDRADQASTDRIVKKQSRGSVFAQNGWAMSRKALKKQSKAADQHIQNLRKALEKTTP